MTQADLDREVSRATGESMRTVRRHGFVILPFPGSCQDDELPAQPPQVIDWDEQDALHRRAA